MPAKKKKYNARFPAGRIKKIMQSDEEIGKVAQAVPVIISKTLELFVESLLKKTLKITLSRNAKTLSTSHMKQCIMSEQRFDFLRELVKNIPDISVAEETAANNIEDDDQITTEDTYPDSDTPFDLSLPSTSTQASRIVPAKELIHKRKCDQNGGGGVVNKINSTKLKLDDSNRLLLKRESDSMHVYQQQIPTVASSSKSTSNSFQTCASSISNADNSYLTPKLLRYDSTPSGGATDGSLHLRHRLAQHSFKQSYSNVTQNQESQPYIAVKPQKKETDNQKCSKTALPAPIISYDFYNKPMVKIDYSNLQMPTITTTAPLSAPASMNNANDPKEFFNFKKEPIINIDLSSVNTINCPSVQTINVNVKSSTIIPKDTTVMPFSTNISVMNTTNKINNKNSFFELDEDYDNI